MGTFFEVALLCPLCQTFSLTGVLPKYMTCRIFVVRSIRGSGVTWLSRIASITSGGWPGGYTKARTNNRNRRHLWATTEQSSTMNTFQCPVFLLGNAGKDMENTRKEVFPECRSFRRIKHHAKNLASLHQASVELQYFYTCAAMAYIASDYVKHMDLIRTHCPDVHEAIIQADSTNFAQHNLEFPLWFDHSE